MEHADFREDLSQFADLVGASTNAADASVSPSPTPTRGANDLVAETRERQEKLRQTVRTLQDSLDHLRLSVKYLVFDLEATRRENEYLRKLLDASHG